MLIVEEKTMPLELDEKIRHGLVACFPADAEVFSRTRAWHGSAPAWSVLLLDAAHVVAHCGVVERSIRVGDVPLLIGGIQNVFVLPALRGQGLCDIVMRASMSEAMRRGYDCGLLFCTPALEKTYSRVGWKSLGDEREVTRIDESGDEVPIPEKNIAMYHALKRPEFPLGTIHLQGNDW